MDFYHDFPNTFALRIAKKVGLLNLLDDTLDAEELLGEFQHFSILCGFEEAMQAYYINDIDEDMLEEKHIMALKAIHAATRPWVLGKTIGYVLNNLSSKPIESATLILSKLLEKGEVDEDQVERFLVELTKKN